MDKVRWLLIGAGDIATRRVGPALVATPNSELLAVCDCRPERAAALAEGLGARTSYADYATALAESGADAVYVATPQTTHLELGLAVLAAGKNLLCEKPLALNGVQALQLLRAARQSPRIASCSNYRRLSAQYQLTEAMLQRGEIGELVGGWAIYSTPFYNPANAPICQALGLSRIKELGFYLLDIIHNFMGLPSSVMAQTGLLNPAVMNDVEELATVVLKFPRGGLFTILLNCSSPGTRHELEWFGTAGRIYWPQWPPHDNGPVVKITGSGTEQIEAHTPENWHQPMINDFVEALLTGREPVCTLESAAKTEIITDAIFRSISSGRTEPVVWEG